MTHDWQGLAGELQELLSLEVSPIAITFLAEVPAGIPAYEGVMPAPTPDGRTGKVAAGCVFWVKATDRTFVTLPADHGNCSVGSMTHGLKTLQEMAGNADVAALLASGWVTMEVVPQIPVVRQKPHCITYGPLQEARYDPDVVLLRLNPKQVMIMHDAMPGMRMEGKPQCHIIAIAKEQQEVAASVGCMLSRWAAVCLVLRTAITAPVWRRESFGYAPMSPFPLGEGDGGKGPSPPVCRPLLSSRD